MSEIQLNEKILKLANALNLQIVEIVGKAGIKYYKVFTASGIEIGRIGFNCPYKQFLEQITVNAVSEVDRLHSVNEELGEANKELCDDLSSIRAEYDI